MGVYIVGFICALVLAAIVIGWVAYCMFIRERHKSEYYQYNISDLKHRNYLLSLQEDDEVKKEVRAGIIFLPSRHKQTDDYENRPDYPESPAPITPNERLIEINDELNDNCVESTAHYKDGIYEVDCAPAPYHSDV